MKRIQATSIFGICVSTIVLSTTAPSVKAAENISLSYQGSEVSVTRSELESFTDTGVLPLSIQDLLGTDETIPVAIRELLNREIRIPGFVEKFLNSSTGEFALGQLDDTISNASGRTGDDLSNLKIAFSEAASDRRVSFIELVRAYPQRNVRVDLTNLEGTYNRVSNFVERVEPALAVAKDVLSDLICDCENIASETPQNPALNASTETLHTNGQPCSKATATIAESEESVQPAIAEDERDVQVAAQ